MSLGRVAAVPARRTPRFIAAALAGTIALAGCTGSPGSPDRGDTADRDRSIPPSSAPTWTGPAPSDEPASADQAFVVAADRACEQAIRTLAATPSPAPAPTPLPPLEQHLSRVEVALDALADDLSALEPPASGVEDHAALVSIVAEEAAAVRQARVAASAGDTAERDRHLEEAAALEDDFGARARELALVECGRLATTKVT